MENKDEQVVCSMLYTIMTYIVVCSTPILVLIILTGANMFFAIQYLLQENHIGFLFLASGLIIGVVTSIVIGKVVFYLKEEIVKYKEMKKKIKEWELNGTKEFRKRTQ